MCKLAFSTELRQSITPRYYIHFASNLFANRAEPVISELILHQFVVLHVVRLNPERTTQSELVTIYCCLSYHLRYFRDCRFKVLNTFPIGLDWFTFRLHLEHQMAEESIDSGVSSEHSQYALEQVRTSNDCSQFAKACGPILLSRSQFSHTEGYYGPRPPYPSRFYPYFDSDCYSGHLVYSDSKTGKPLTSLPNRPLFYSFDSTSEVEFSDSKSSSIQLSTSRTLSPSGLVLPRQFEFNTKSEQVETMSSNPLDHARSSFHPQGSSSTVQDIRGGNPRMVHFLREQQQQKQNLYEVGTTYGCSSPTNQNVVDRLTGLAGVGTPAVDSRPPLQRNYSTRDYAYLPPLGQILISSPLTSPLQSANIQATSSKSIHIDEIPGVPIDQKYPMDINALDPIANSSGQLQDYDRRGGRPTLEGLLRDFSLGSRSTEQQKQLLCALLTGSKKSSLSTASQQTSLLQNVVQKSSAISSASNQRDVLNARWSDSDVAACEGQPTHYQQQQQLQQRLKFRQQQQQAAVAAAAAAAVAIAAMQGAPKIAISSMTTSVNLPVHTPSYSQSQPFLFKRPPLHRSCYSSGDEDSVAPGQLQGVNSSRTNLYYPPRLAHPKSNIISNQTQAQPTVAPSIHAQPSQPPPSLNMTQQVMSQLAQLQTFKSEDYANYQSLETILGQMYPQPPPPAPVQPDIYGLRTHLLEDYYAPHSIASTSTTQASVATTLHLREPGEAKCGLLPLHLDPVVGVESGQLEDPTDIKLEERFADFFVLPSERCVTTPYPTSSGQITSSEYEWNLPNPDNPGKVVQPRSEKLSGILVIDLVAGNGLSSSQVLLRDLYCVIEMDSIRKARSMIRTSTSYFEWNEVFELDMDENRFLAFLLYQWDPRTKHRLCFYGGIDLRNLVQRLAKIPQNCTVSSNLINQPPRQNFLLSPALSMIPTNFDKIALQLEPRGVLYLEFTHYPLDRVYHRYQPTVSTSLQHASISDDVLFGVPIDELIERERVIAQLMRTRYPASVTAVSSLTPEHVPYVPLFIRKCIEEIDRRGTDVVGIYRLTGSVWMKLQVRDLFNRITKSTLRAIFRGDRKAVEAIIEAVDLSAERVPDIHALTALFKDFLRELPEPLFTSALYPMFYDAMQVSLPGFSQSGAKLMLNILDCLPTSNQEILLYLLDHFKRVTNQSEVNKMNTHHLATCLAPVLFYPAPNAARSLDPSILEPRRMTEIFKFILEIWPDERTDYAMPAGSVDMWPPTSGYHRAGSSPPTLDPRYRETRHHVVDSAPHRMHKAKHSYRASSSTRSTLSGPAAPRIFNRSPPYEPRSMSFAGKTEAAKAARSEQIGMGRSGRIKFTSLSGPTARFEPVVEFHPVHMTEGNRPSATDRASTSAVHFLPQRKSNSQTDVVGSRHMNELETEVYSAQAEEQSRRTMMRPRFQDVPTTGSTGTDSGTRSSLSVGGKFIPPVTRQSSFVKKGTRPNSARSYSQERPYTRSPRPVRRSQPYS